jgi:CRP-like cAMP-binding protein
MSIDTGVEPEIGPETEQARPLSLSTAAARNLATTTKTPPQMQGISSRWLLRKLPWVEVSGGTYRVNRRLRYTAGRGRVAFVQTGDDVRVAASSLVELPVLRGVEDADALAALAALFTRRDLRPGETLAEQGAPADRVVLVAHGKVEQVGAGKYGDRTVLGVLADGDHAGDEALAAARPGPWPYTATAATACTVFELQHTDFRALSERSQALRDQVRAYAASADRSQDRHGQAAIALAAGHAGEVELPGTFVDYELAPREYGLGVAQTVLRVHSRVADLYNDPMDQIDEQLKLTVHALRERQEAELVNNRDFGLLHNADYDQRISTRTGPPTPDDLDDLLAMRRDTTLLLAHPKAIAAFLRECNRRGITVNAQEIDGRRSLAWRGVPIFPCGKIPVEGGHTTSILALRTGADNQGVVGLHQTGIPDEYEPGLNVRFMGIDAKAVISYLVSTYFSAAVLVPDALGILENAEIAAPRS